MTKSEQVAKLQKRIDLYEQQLARIYNYTQEDRPLEYMVEDIAEIADHALKGIVVTNADWNERGLAYFSKTDAGRTFLESMRTADTNKAAL